MRSIRDTSMTFVLLGSWLLPVAARNKPFNDFTRLVVINMLQLSGDTANRRDCNLPFWEEQKQSEEKRLLQTNTHKTALAALFNEKSIETASRTICMIF